MYVSRSLMHIKYLISSPCPLCIYIITVFVYHSGLPNMASLTTIFAVYFCFNLAYCMCVCVCSYTYILSTMCVLHIVYSYCVFCMCMTIMNTYTDMHSLFYSTQICAYSNTHHIYHIFIYNYLAFRGYESSLFKKSSLFGIFLDYAIICVTCSNSINKLFILFIFSNK